MKEHPIRFTGPEVRAILDGRKTQTRRFIRGATLQACQSWSEIEGQWVFWHDSPTRTEKYCVEIPPEYQPGDELWVREACRLWCPDDDGECGPWRARYRADDSVRITDCGWDEGPGYDTPHSAGVAYEQSKWSPSIHMPRWASRITLRVTDVRVQRVQEISELECEVEIGAEPYATGNNAVPLFEALWNFIHAKHPERQWGANPWVVAITFERVSTGVSKPCENEGKSGKSDCG